MSSINGSNTEIHKASAPSIAGSGDVAKPVATDKAKAAAIADTAIRTAGAVAFAPYIEPAPANGTENANLGASLTAIATEGAPTPVTAERVVIWKAENNWTSKGETKTVALPNVTIGKDGVRAKWVQVTGLTQVTSIDDQKPFEGTSKVTRDAFDQANLLADGVLWNEMQAKVGIDNDKLWKASKNDGVIRSKANGVSDLNAFYSPTANDQTYGTNNGKWHLASDNDVTGHETGHNRGDKQNPDMFSGEGGAIHEGYFGDFACALKHRNPNLSEDFGTALGTPGQPLRNLDNDKTLRQAGSEVHDRGEAYGGFGWRVTQALAKRMGGDLAKACDVMLHVGLKTGFYFTTKSPKPSDFLDAVARCVRDALPKVVDAETVEFMIQAIKAEGVKREMIKSDWKEPPRLVQDDAKAVALNAALAGKPSTCSPEAAMAAVDKVWGKRKDAELTVASVLGWKNPASGLLSQKVIMQLRAIDPASGKKYAVQDGFMSMLATGTDVSVFDGTGRREILDKGDAYKFDFTPLPGDREALIKKAREAIDRFIKKDLETRKHLKTHLESNKANFFADDALQIEEVMYKGKINLMITSPAGQFIYDHISDTVAGRRLMFVDLFPGKKQA